MVHSLACALTAEQLGVFRAEARKKSTIVVTTRAMSEEEEKERGQTNEIIGWHFIEPQREPRPTHEIRANRLFSV